MRGYGIKPEQNDLFAILRREVRVGRIRVIREDSKSILRSWICVSYVFAFAYPASVKDFSIIRLKSCFDSTNLKLYWNVHLGLVYDLLWRHGSIAFLFFDFFDLIVEILTSFISVTSWLRTFILGICVATGDLNIASVTQGRQPPPPVWGLSGRKNCLGSFAPNLIAIVLHFISRQICRKIEIKSIYSAPVWKFWISIWKLCKTGFKSGSSSNLGRIDAQLGAWP